MDLRPSRGRMVSERCRAGSAWPRPTYGGDALGRSRTSRRCSASTGRARTGPHFNRLDPRRFLDVRRNVDVLIFDRPGGRNLERFSHLEHFVRRADHPAVRIHRRLRHVRVVPLRRAAVGPLQQRGLVGSGKAAFVDERAFGRLRVPRRHVTRLDFFNDGARVRPRVFVGQQGHRGDLAGPMT